MNYIGDFPEDFTTVAIYFTTYGNNGAPAAPSSAYAASDVKIYKNGSATEKTTTNGLTMTSPFDSIVGLHRLLVDTSNDTGDASFWVTGTTYSVVLTSIKTVGSQPSLKEIGTFGIVLAPSGTGSAPSAATIADSVWDEARSGHVASGSFGEGVASVRGNVTGSTASIASGGIDAATFASGALDAVWSVASRLLTAGTNIILAKGTGVTGFNDLSAAQVNAEADTALADVGVTSTVTGRIDVATSTRATQTSVDAIGGGTAPTAAAVADAVWDEARADHVTAGTFGQGAAAIQAKTDNLPTDPADQSLLIAATDALAALIGDVPTNSELATALASADDATLAAIAALTFPTVPTADQNADALLDRANGVETGLTPRQAMRLSAAADAGKVSGADTSTNTIRNAVADSKDRIVATVDSKGNRSAITYDLT